MGDFLLLVNYLGQKTKRPFFCFNNEINKKKFIAFRISIGFRRLLYFPLSSILLLITNVCQSMFKFSMFIQKKIIGYFPHTNAKMFLPCDRNVVVDFVVFLVYFRCEYKKNENRAEFLLVCFLM